MIILRYTLISCAMLERVTAADNLFIRNNLSRPSASRISVAPPAPLAKALNGTLEIKSMKKEPFKYVIAMMWGSLISILCFGSRYVVLNLIMISMRKNRSTQASMKDTAGPIKAE